jgi:hypothetical protein
MTIERSCRAHGTAGPTMILHALILGAAGAISGLLLQTVGDPQSGVTNFPGGFVFGAILAGYLWIVLGVRSFARAAVVWGTTGAAFVVASFAMVLVPLFVPLIEQVTGTSGLRTTLFMRFVFAGTAGGGLVSMVLLVSLPWPRGTTRIGAEMLLCAAAGGILGAAGAMLEDPLQFSNSTFGAVWQGGMGVVLALIAESD